MKSKPEFEATFQALRGMLKKHAKELKVAADKPGKYWLDAYDEKRKRAILFAAAVVQKNYVSFHLMPVYMNKTMQEAISESLRKHMQGKACFNFKTIEPDRIKELAALTAKGFQGFKKAGYI